MEEAKNVVWIFDYTNDMKFINNVDHTHTSSEEDKKRFKLLATELAIEDQL